MDYLRRIWSASAVFVILAGTGGQATSDVENFDNSFLMEDTGQVLALVGERVATSPIDEEALIAAAEEAGGVFSHYSIQARYRVLELVHGRYDRDLVDFEAFDEFGSFEFVRHSVVMIYLLERDGFLVHADYQYDPVHRTADGRFAFCGDPYAVFEEEGIPIDRRPLEELSFSSNVALAVGSEDLERKYGSNYFSPPAFSIEGDQAVCRRGVYVDELFRIQNETIFLPWSRAEMCEQQVSETRGDLDSEEDFEAVNACLRNLEDAP